MTHSLPPLDTEDLTPWYEEDAPASRLGCSLFFAFIVAFWSAIGFAAWRALA